MINFIFFSSFHSPMQESQKISITFVKLCSARGSLEIRDTLHRSHRLYSHGFVTCVLITFHLYVWAVHLQNCVSVFCLYTCRNFRIATASLLEMMNWSINPYLLTVSRGRFGTNVSTYIYKGKDIMYMILHSSSYYLI